MMRTISTFLLLLLLLLLPLFLWGCATCEDCGRISESHRATRVFTSLEILPEHNYFYHGELLDPVAILAIRDSYRLQGKFWTPIDLTQEQLDRWVRDAERRPLDGDASPRYGGRYQGAEILDPQGRLVGFWYSRYDRGTFRFPGDRTVIAYPPDLSSSPGSLFGRRDR